MKLFRECTLDEILELLGIETEVELPKLKEEKVTLEDLWQKLINHLYNLNPNSYDQNDIKILEILLFNKNISSQPNIKELVYEVKKDLNKEKEVLKTTFSESIRNSLEATGGKPLYAQE